MCDGILFDETVYERLSEVKKPIFVFDWLRNLDQILPAASKQTIRECQEDLVQQLLNHLSHASGPPTQKLIGRCLAKLFLVGDTVLLYTAVNTCNSLLKTRDDGACNTSCRLAAITCLGTMYKYLGRMIGRSFDDSVSLMVKLIKQSESQVRCETMNTLCNLLQGVGAASSMCHKEIYKAAKSCMTDRVPSVRAAAAKCMNALAEHYTVIHTSDLEATVSLCLRCMDCSNYTVRLEAARLLGRVLARTQNALRASGSSASLGTASTGSGSSLAANASSRVKVVTLRDAMGLLASGFLKGPGGFLKGSSASDMIKGTNSVNREVRIGVTYAYIEFFTLLGSQCFEANLASIIAHCTNLLASARAVPTHSEAMTARNCVGFIMGTLYRRLLSEPVQLVAARELVSLLRHRLQTESSCEELGGTGGVETSGNADSVLDGQDSMVDSVMADDLTESVSSGSAADHTSGGRTADADSGLGRRGFGRGSTRTQRQQQQQQQHVIISILDQLTQLIHWLDSLTGLLLEPPVQLADLLCSALTHNDGPVRLAAANCLRQLTIALPNQRTVLLDRCIGWLQQAQRSNSEAILGYSNAIAGILAGASVSTLGIPANRLRQVFALADELLRAANQNSRLTLPRTQAGWTLLAACMTLGPDLVKPHLPKMLLFWRNAFPRSARELESEKQRGDAFTWQVMLESRAGALCSMQSFLECCSSMLSTEEAIRRLLAPIECALNMLTHMLDIVRIYGNHLKATASLIRHRLYRILLLLPPTAYTMFVYHLRQSGLRQQGSYSILLRELVAEFTLTDNAANTTTSLLRWLCRTEDSVTLGSWVPDTDHKLLEEQLQPNGGATPGALEHDPAYLFLRDGLIWAATPIAGACDIPTIDSESDVVLCSSASLSASFYDGSSAAKFVLLGLHGPSYAPWSSSSVAGAAAASAASACAIHLYGPPPISVAVIDSAVELFGRIFPCVPVRHRTQMMEHFAECIRLTKSTRQEAVQINVFTALLGAMRRLAETKAAFGEDPELRKSTINLILAALTSPSVLLRCSAGECLGRLAQVVAEPNFLTELAQQIFDRLRTVRVPVARSGHCLAVGCLHRYVGGLASGQHLSTSVGVLLAIAQDSSVPEVQVWALHALALVADSGGPMFREYVEPSLNLVLQLLLRSPTAMNEIQRSLGRLLGSLITTLGPELQGSGPQIATARHSCLLCCLIMQDSADALLQAEAINCLQRLHMFAPQHAHPTGLLPVLQACVSSPHLLLRRAAVSYMRQLSQKEANKLCTFDAVDATASNYDSGPVSNSPKKTGPDQQTTRVTLELLLFGRLDVETDLQTRRDIEEILLNMLQASAHTRFGRWLGTLKEVLQATTADKAVRPVPFRPGNGTSTGVQPDLAEAREPRSGSLDSTAASSNHVNDDDGDDDAGADINLGDSVAKTTADARVASKISARWSTRVFAVNCVRILISACARLARTAATSPQSTLIHLPSGPLLTADDQLVDGRAPDENDLTARGVPVDPNAVAHFDLALARCLRQTAAGSTNDDWLVLHLADLIRIAFMSATSDSESLRIVGLRLMREVIEQFAPVPDPDCAGHIILEQYQAQVSAALRPAFSSTTTTLDNNRLNGSPRKSTPWSQPSPELTAAACQVCSAWIGSGVARNPNDLQRVHELLRQAFDKLQLAHSRPSISTTTTTVTPTATTTPTARDSFGSCVPALTSNTGQQIYCEDAVTMEQLAVLRSWADVYLVAMRYASLSGKSRSALEQHCADATVGSHEAEFSDQEDEEEADDYEENESEEDEEGIQNGKGRFHGNASFEGTDDPEISKTTGRATRRHNRRAYHLLFNLVRPVLSTLAQAWIAVLQDYALLTLPDELANQRPANGGTFFGPDANIERVRFYFAQHWSTVVHAVSTWLQNELFRGVIPTDPNEASSCGQYFHLLLGLCLEALSGASEKQSVAVINTCLRSMCCLLSRPLSRSLLMRVVPEMPVELLYVLYRLLLTRDTIQTHLLCLQNVNQVLIAAEERLVKQREVWLSKDSPGDLPHALLTPDSHNTNGKSNGISMVSSMMLQTTSLVDAEMYELGEGGSLASFPGKSEASGSETEQTTPLATTSTVGLQPGRSIVFACLEIVMCILARYQPALVDRLRSSDLAHDGSSFKTNKSTIPETRCSDSPNAPFVLATAIRCCISVPDLCAPSVLLSSLDLISARQAADLSTSSPNNRHFGAKDNLLPVFLDLVVQIAQASLIQPTGTSLCAIDQTALTDRAHRPDPTDLPELQRCMSAGAWADSEISSSTTCSPLSPSGARRRRRAHERQQQRVHRLIRWTWQQAALADQLCGLVQKLALHHYPTLACSLPPVSPNELEDKPRSKSGRIEHSNQVQPDSSSGGSGCDVTGDNVDSPGANTKANCSIKSAVHAQPLPRQDSRAQAASEWYDLISTALWRLLRHDHVKSGEVTTSTCCFASVTLVSRIVAGCPTRLLQYEPLRKELCMRLCQMWSQAGQCESAKPPAQPKEANSASTAHRAAWLGLPDRYVCLVAINALINHRDPVASAFFVRTLTPQIFRWLHDLSYMDNEVKTSSAGLDPISKDELTSALHLSMEVLESVLDLSDSTSRPNLLVILVPLLCSLLCPNPPAASVLHQWSHASHCLPNSAELACGVHLTTLQHLVALAPRFPTEFRSVFGALGAGLRTRLERAIRQSQPGTNGLATHGSNKLINPAVSSSEPTTRPVIQLKTDFSGFDK